MYYSRHSNLKFWLLLFGCSVLFVVSAAFHLLTIRAYEHQQQREFQRTISLVLTTMGKATIDRSAQDLTLLSEITLKKLNVLRFDDSAVQRWLDVTTQHFFETRPAFRGIMVYGADNHAVYAFISPQATIAPLQCVTALLQPDGFCEERGELAYRVSVPLYDALMIRRGTMTAVVTLSSTLLHQTELLYGVALTATHGERLLYAHAPDLLPEQTPQGAIITPAFQRVTFQEAPSRLMSRRGMWYVYRLRLGDAADQFFLHFYYSINYLVWKYAEAAIFNAVLLIALVVFFAGVIICARDIREEDRLHLTISAMEETQFTSEAILAQFLAATPEIVVIKDREGVIQRASRAAAAFYGKATVWEVLGQRDADCFAPEDAAQLADGDAALLSGECDALTFGDVAVHDAPRAARRLLLTKFALRDKTGRVVRLLIMAQDMTEMMTQHVALQYAVSLLSRHFADSAARKHRKATDAIEQEEQHATV